ncbi:MAG: hypothetical protein HXS54_06015 [Theionarchaea archaeon]|nr:hypothetical protein [Theionarchaea archaeon]DBA34816.1 TPA_asm: hypothetical protein vir521_00022 [Caudoviricetes sp. vir521]
MTKLQEEVERILEKHLSEDLDLMKRKAIEWGVEMDTRKEIRDQLRKVKI